MSPHCRRPSSSSPGAARSREVACTIRRRPRRGLSRCLAALSICLASAACSQRAVETETAPPRATEAMVRVVNRTSSAVRVEADGRPLGEVPAGGEHFFVGLAPGTIDLRGRSLDDQLTFHRDLLTLEAGETFTWILREGEGGAATEAARAHPTAPPGGATIVVVNTTEWEVQVVLDGDALGTTPAGRTGRYEGIEPGAHRLEARAPETTFPQEFPVLEPGEIFTWRLRGPGAVAAPGILPVPGTGRLRVENPNSEPVRILINGVLLGVVEPRNVRIFDNLSAASVRLSGESGDGSTRYEGPSARIEAGRVTTWRIGAGRPGELAGGQPDVDGPRREPRFPAEDPRSTDEDLDPDPLPVLDRRPDDVPPLRPPGAGDEGAVGEDLPARQPAAAGRVFIVENHTTQDLQIFFDGLAAGVVGAGMTERFSDLPGTRFTPTARSASGAREFGHPEVDLEGRDSFSWIIVP